MWTWHLGTWVRGSIGSAGGTVKLDLRGFSNPKNTMNQKYLKHLRMVLPDTASQNPILQAVR